MTVVFCSSDYIESYLYCFFKVCTSFWLVDVLI